MDFFEAFSLLVAGGLLVAAFFRQRIVHPASYRKALSLLLVALILYYPVSALFAVGVYLSFVARPIGFVLGIISLGLLCKALGAQNDSGT